MLDARGTGVPAIVHWGADLGDVSDADLAGLADASVAAVANAAVDVPIRLSVLPQLDQAWLGRPALALTSGDFGFQVESVEREAGLIRIALGSAACTVAVDYELTPEGLLRGRVSVANRLDSPLGVNEANLILPLPARAHELLDFSGRWSGERRPQRRAVQDGAWTRESRHGRGGHDGVFLSIAGTPGFGFRTGEVWGVHLGWSGNQRVWVERVGGSLTAVGTGELLAAGEVVLGSADTYTSPWAYGSWSDRGMDGMSERFHAFVRRTTASSDRPHPLLLNTWEAVYFDQDDAALRELADTAASVGVERFVLDDGWMAGRTDDTRGLGDWTVDRARRPDGLTPLIEQAASRGMDFGLWVEPEMLTADSATATEHPDWILRDVPGGSLPLTARHQYVLDLSIQAAFDHVLAQLDALLTEYPIAYLKWDHNRDQPTPRAHAQTLALYRLLDELHRRHPTVEIEACASGGARIDLGVLDRIVRVWPSDNNDPLERQAIYRWTSLLVPPEMFGAHLGATTSHITGRTHDLSYRLATSLFGWAGIEWDLREATGAQLSQVGMWATLYKEVRPLVARGNVVRADRDDNLWVHGIVAPDASEALFSISAVSLGDAPIPAPVQLPGLDARRRYSVELVSLGDEPRLLAVAAPPWMTADRVELPGRLLSEVGLAAPPLAPEQTVLLRVRALEA